MYNTCVKNWLNIWNTTLIFIVLKTCKLYLYNQASLSTTFQVGNNISLIEVKVCLLKC